MSNNHIKAYLEYYVALPGAPGYAVLINGAWGIGKTHVIGKLVEQLKANGRAVNWVSLYGVQSPDEIDLRLIAAWTAQKVEQAESSAIEKVSILGKLFPKPQGKFMRGGGRLAAASVKYFNLGELLQASGLSSWGNPDLIVFDDLERGMMSAQELLGYINQFVEQEGRKVVIIANEAEIEKKESEKKEPDYRTVREKVIGQSFNLRADVLPALNAFVKGMTDESARKYVEANKSALLSVFQQSGSENLRVLKQVLLTWDRVFPAINAELREKPDAMLVVFKLFVALCAEVRLGRLSAGDLKGRINNIVAGSMAKGKGGSPTGLSAASERYPELHLHDSVLTDDVLVHALCEGRVDANEINASLRQSQYFLTPAEEPAWRKVWYGMERSPEEFQASFSEMEQQFKNRFFLENGEVMHVFALRLWCAKIGMLKESLEEVVKDCKAYVDDLTKDERILVGAPNERRHFSGAYGLAFMQAETPEFKELDTYYEAAVMAAKERRWPAEAKAAMAFMATNIEAFFGKMCRTHDERAKTYLDAPVFSTVPTSEFVDRLLKIDPKDFREVMRAFKERYGAGELSRELQAEKAWAREVRDLLLKKADTQVPIRKFAIRNDVGWALTPYVDYADNA
jgi:hypothetical protein